jgi:hypothetical protein
MPPSANSTSSAPRAARKRCSFDGCRKLAPAGRKRCDEHKPGQSTSPPGSGPGRKKLTGRTEPRLFTPPLRPLTRKTSLGFEVIDFARAIGEPLLPWQEWALIHALELNRDDSFRFRTILILVARQNGKSTLARILTLWRLYLDGARLVLGAAQDVTQAREQWSFCLEMIRACPDLNAELDGKPRHVNGDEWFRVTGGGRYKITAANEKAGRGMSADLLLIDELKTHTDWRAWGSLESTTRARPRAQTWAMSNMGGDEAVVLNRLRDKALGGSDQQLAIFEWSAPEGCELEDRQAWAQANPALGYLFDESSIEAALLGPAEVVRAETLCQAVRQLNGAINVRAWSDCADPAASLGQHRDRVAAVFDVAPDGEHAILVLAASLHDGRIRLQVAHAWKNTDDARRELPALLASIKPAAFGWFSGGPGAGMATTLRSLAMKYNKRPGKREPGAPPEDGAITKTNEVCQEFADLVKALRIAHPADPLLDAQIGGASKLKSGDGWRFTRGGGEHVNGPYACAGAVSLALTMPPAKRARIRMISA